MAFSDWTPFNNGDVTMVQTSLNPIVGGGSLRMEAAGVSSANTGGIFPDTLPHGFNQGRLESLFRVQSDNGTGAKTFGLVANVSDETNPITAANAYGMIVDTSGGGSWDTIRLVKWTGGGGIGGAFSTLQSVTIGTPVDTGDTFAFQFDWISDVATFGGTKLVCRFQEAANFTSIPAVIDHVDATSPLTTSETEGFYLSCDTAGGAIVINCDTSSLYEIT